MLPAAQGPVGAPHDLKRGLGGLFCGNELADPPGGAAEYDVSPTLYDDLHKGGRGTHMRLSAR